MSNKKAYTIAVTIIALALLIFLGSLIIAVPKSNNEQEESAYIPDSSSFSKMQKYKQLNKGNTHLISSVKSKRTEANLLKVNNPLPKAETNFAWEATSFPAKIATPASLGKVKIVSGEIAELSNNQLERRTILEVESSNQLILSVESNDGYGGIKNQEFYSAEWLKVTIPSSKLPELYNKITEELRSEVLAVSSSDHKITKLRVQSPANAPGMEGFKNVLEEHLGTTAKVELDPIYLY